MMTACLRLLTDLVDRSGHLALAKMFAASEQGHSERATAYHLLTDLNPKSFQTSPTELGTVVAAGLPRLCIVAALPGKVRSVCASKSPSLSSERAEVLPSILRGFATPISFPSKTQAERQAQTAGLPSSRGMGGGCRGRVWHWQGCCTSVGTFSRHESLCSLPLELTWRFF